MNKLPKNNELNTSATITEVNVSIIKPRVPEKWDMEADVVTLGFGGAGATASIAAHDAGVKVLILEKAPENLAGGNTVSSGGGARIPMRVDDKTIEYYRNLSFGTVPEEMNVDLVKAFASIPEWLNKKGVAFVKRGGGENFSYYNVIPGPPGYEKWGAGRELYQALKNCILERKIEVIYESPAKELIQNPDTKEILGVAAEKHGEKFCIKANKGVILAVGGYEANYEMQGYFNFPGVKIFPTGTPFNTGDGIKMVSEVGAALWHMVSIEWGMVAIKLPSEIYGSAIPMTNTDMSNNYIFVNKYGNRFMNEDKNLIHHKGPLELIFFNQTKREYPNLPFYCIFDETCRLHGPLGKRPLAVATGGAPFCWNGVHDIYEWSDDNSVEIEKGWIIQANNISELAVKMKIDPAGLTDTISKYNKFCQTRADADFARPESSLMPVITPPYYGMELALSCINTQGGPKHNSRGQTLGYDNQPIPRLYSVGEFGSVFGFLYPGGSNLAEALSFGRIAGEQAATLTPW